MAGTLTISTLSDGTNSTSSTNCIQGSAKAWVNFDASSGTVCTIRSSYNVSSVTFNATGNFTVNYTNAFPNVNYAAVCTSRRNVSNNPSFAHLFPLGTYSTTQTQVRNCDTGNTANNPDIFNLSSFSL